VLIEKIEKAREELVMDEQFTEGIDTDCEDGSSQTSQLSGNPEMQNVSRHKTLKQEMPTRYKN